MMVMVLLLECWAEFCDVTSHPNVWLLSHIVAHEAVNARWHVVLGVFVADNHWQHLLVHSPFHSLSHPLRHSRTHG